jgi:predicted O-methyltransferase YrrM
MTTICLAAALQDNEGGKRGIVIGAESEPGNAGEVDTSLDSEGLGDLIEIREGSPLLTLATDIPRPVDLVFLDGAKHLYLPVLEILEPHLTAGSLVIADNAGRSDGYLPPRPDQQQYLSSPAADDIESSVRTHPTTPPDQVTTPLPRCESPDHAPHRAALELGGSRKIASFHRTVFCYLWRSTPPHTAMALVVVA